MSKKVNSVLYAEAAKAGLRLQTNYIMKSMFVGRTALDRLKFDTFRNSRLKRTTIAHFFESRYFFAVRSPKPSETHGDSPWR